MSNGSLLGVSVLELRTDQTHLDAGLASAKAKQARASAEMQASMDRAGKATDAAAMRLRGYQLAVDSSQTRVNALGRALQAGQGHQQKLNDALSVAQTRLSAAQGRADAYATSVGAGAAKTRSYQQAVEAAQGRVDRLGHSLQTGRGHQQGLNDSLAVAQGRLSLAQGRADAYANAMGSGALKTHRLSGETRTLSAETGISSRAMKDLYERMGPIGTAMGDLTTRTRLYREHGIDYLAAGTLGLGAGFLAMSVHAAVGFEELTNTVQRQTGLSGRSLEELMRTIRVVGRDSPYQLAQVTDAAVILRQSFHENDTQIGKSANLMVAFARAAGQDVRPEMQQLSRIMTDYRQPLGNVVGLTDKLVGVSQATQQPLSTMVDALDRFGPKLQALGFGLNDSVRLLGVFSASGIKADQMGRGLASALTNVTKAMSGPKDGQLRLEQYGLAVQTAQQRVDTLSHTLGTTWAGNQGKVNAQLQVAQARLDIAKQKYAALNDTLKAAKGAHGDVSGAIHNEIRQITDAHSKQQALNLAVEYFGKNLGPSMARAFYNNQDALRKVDAALGKTGETQRLFNVDAKSLPGEIQRAKNNFQDLEIAVGNKLVPALSHAVDWLRNTIHGVDDFTKHHKDLVMIAGGILGIGSALTLLSRHSPLGDILGRVLTNKGHAGLGSFLSGKAGSGMWGVAGPDAAGSLKNPVMVRVEGGIPGAGGGGSPLGGGPSGPQSRTSRILRGLGHAAAVLPFVPVAYELGQAVAPPEVQPGTSAYGRQVLQNRSAAFRGYGSMVSSGSASQLSASAKDFRWLANDPDLGKAAQAQFAVQAARFKLAFNEISHGAANARAELAKLANGSQGIRATAFNLDFLAKQAVRVGDVKMAFADHLGAEMLRSRSVSSKGVTNIIHEFDKLPPKAKAAASQTMIAMTQALEQQKRLPLGSTTRFVTLLLKNYKDVKDQGGVYFKGLMTDTGAVMDKLRTKIATSTGQQKKDALTQYHDLQRQVGTVFDQQLAKITVSMDKSKKAIQSNTGDAARVAGQNLGDFTKSVDTAMSAGTIASNQGSSILTKSLNATLKAFGAKPIPYPILDKLVPSHQPVFVGGGHAGHFAGGGLVQVGRPGAAGRDEIPMNAGGIPIVVGDGEQVAVFNRHQQAVMDYALGPIGGLQGLFTHVTQPHYAARGGLLGTRYAKGGQIVTASDFGGPNDPSAYMHSTASGKIMNGSLVGFAELSNPPGSLNFSALGHLPMGTMLPVTYGGKTITIPKVDVGAGGPGLHGHVRAIDLTQPAANQLGFPGLADVIVGNPAGINLGAAGGGGSASFPPIVAPKVKGGGTLGNALQAALNKEAAAANKYAQAHAPVASVGGVGGLAGAPQLTGRAGVDKMIQEATAIAAHNYPYLWGGGHGTLGVGPFDCSGAVSAVLGADGLVTSPHVAQEYMSFGDSGPGKWISIFASPSHVFMELMGHYFGTSGQNPGGGANWIGSFPESMPAVRHPHGFARGGLVIRDDLPESIAKRVPPELREKERQRHRRNRAAILPGLARGGLIPLSGALGDGGVFAPGGFVTARAGRGSYPRPTRAPGGRRPHSRSRGSSGSRGGAAGGSTVHHAAKAPRPPKMPHLKAFPGFDPTAPQYGDEIASVGRWQSFIEGLHGRVQVTPTITDPSGTDHVNIGDPHGLPNRLSGQIDPTTGLQTKSIWDRLREIGSTADRMNPNAPSLADTELGLDETLLDDYLKQQQAAGQVLALARAAHPLDAERVGWLTRAADASTSLRALGRMDFSELGMYSTPTPLRTGFGWRPEWQRNPWFSRPQDHRYTELINRKVQDYKNLLARIARLNRQREKLPLEKARKEKQIADRLAAAKHAIQIGRITSAGGLTAHLLDGQNGINTEEKAEISNLGKASTPPHDWQGDKASWTAQHTLEAQKIRDEYAARRAAIRKSAADARIAASINASNADYALGVEGRNERFAVTEDFSKRATFIRDQTRTDHIYANADKAAINGFLKLVQTQEAAEGTALSALPGYLAPTGDLAIGILQKQQIDIPNLLNEIASLGHTSVAAGAGGGSAIASQLTGLLQQQLATLGQQLAVSQAQYGALSHLGDLPPFGGSFAEGGTVPGPLGAARMILAHGGEKITPADAAPTAVENHIHIQKGSGLEQLIDIRVEQHTRKASRVAGLRLPGRGGGGLV